MHVRLNGQRQRGATLLVSLIMLLLISILAVGGMQGSILQERMATNAQDQAISFEAAESALRTAERRMIDDPAFRAGATNRDRLTAPWDWDGADPAPSGTGDVGIQVRAEPVFHESYLADVCPPFQTGYTLVCFERFSVVSRAVGGSDRAVTVLQSTVLLPPES